ncbi:MAG: 4-hydroxythreonine-4-phosphate dehydrogenase [Campylobacteraceae bacterium]|nr:4-hydroxythreonine-4-phosphate dehydrogenase [Campylobacteraceae bacterium]
MKKLAISMGDLNGIGLEIALRAHEEINKKCKPIYCIDPRMLSWGAALLNLEVSSTMSCIPCGKLFEISPGNISKAAGKASYASFLCALDLVKSGECEALVTLPIHKKAWEKAGVKYIGHTDALEEILGEKALMMIGCEDLYVGLFTHHIPLKDVSKKIKVKKLVEFLLKFYGALGKKPIGVLGLNPHAGDGGVIGKEEVKISKAILKANTLLKEEVFKGPLVPDAAFTPRFREQYKYLIAMYHDQGLAPLKALFFEESINVSLGLSIIRTSVDHGTAFDIAYKDRSPSLKSYFQAIDLALDFANLSDKISAKKSSVK